mgnify:CR=1 FL=1|jgi:hypothetical protein
MWLTGKLGEQKGLRLTSGPVENGTGFAVCTDSRHESPGQLFPYGFASSPEEGREAVMLGGYCAGLANAPAGDLEAGEVRLYSAGGAEILLRNNGQVVINGQVFEPGGGA